MTDRVLRWLVQVAIGRDEGRERRELAAGQMPLPELTEQDEAVLEAREALAEQEAAWEARWLDDDVAQS